MNIYDFLGTRIGNASDAVPVAGSDDSASSAASLYFKAVAVETSVSYVTAALTSCEIKTFVHGSEEHGVLYRLLNVQPNPNQSAAQFVSEAVYRLMTTGEALIVPHRNSLWVADGFTPDKEMLSETVWKSISVDGFSTPLECKAGDAVHLTYWSGPRIKQLIGGMWDAYGELLDSSIDSYESAKGEKWILSLDQAPMGDRSFVAADRREREDPRNALQTFMKAANGVYVQTRGQELNRVESDDSSSSASDVIDIRSDAFSTVAGIYHIPASLLTGNMTNVGDLIDSFLTFTIKPLARQLSEELTAKFIAPEDWEDGSRVVVDTTRIKVTDLFSVASSISQLLGAGFSLDELRGQLDWPLIGTEDAQAHLITKNYAGAEEVLRETAEGGDQKK